MQTAIKEPTEEVSALVQGRIFNIQTFVHNCSIRGLTRNWLDQAWVEDPGRYSSDSRSQGLRAGDRAGGWKILDGRDANASKIFKVTKRNLI